MKSDKETGEVKMKTLYFPICFHEEHHILET